MRIPVTAAARTSTRTTLSAYGRTGRSVDAAQVFELAFEAIAASARHKSGVALRFPRILRWRRDKPAREADTLASLRALLDANEAISARPSTA
jgi:DNA ligase-1